MIYVNNFPINVTMFPDKTSQVWKIPEEVFKVFETIKVKWEFENEGEFLHLAQLKMLLDAYTVGQVNLEISYLPYARQDKPVYNYSTFALRTFAGLLNSLKFNGVSILDPHSEQAIKLIDHSSVISSNMVWDVTQKIKPSLTCYPDSGAFHKYKNSHYGVRNRIYGEKTRNQLTGEITDYKLVGECKNESVLIVDDICDGGKTFILLTKMLLDGGAREVNLFTTHGIFSKGVKVLKESGIRRVFTEKGEVFENENGEITYEKLS